MNDTDLTGIPENGFDDIEIIDFPLEIMMIGWMIMLHNMDVMLSYVLEGYIQFKDIKYPPILNVNHVHPLR